MNALELQVWDNAAFDSDEVPIKASWSSSLDPVFENPSESPDSERSKENLSPVTVNSSVSVKSSIAIKPLHSNGVLGNSLRKPSKVLAKKKTWEQDDERKIDAEIQEIEIEIKRLSSRLEALRLEKAERIAKTTVEKRRRVVPAKFMEAKQSVKKIEETPLSSCVKSKVNRRGLSLGPSEIFAEAKYRPPGKVEMTPGTATQSVKKKIEEPLLSSSVKSKFNRRGMSLGPSEIFATARFRLPGKLETTPSTATQSRRQSCFLQLQDIEKSKSAINERRKSMTVSPKSRKNASKIESQKQAATTTAGSKKLVKKESSLIQPRKLFKDGEKEKSVSTKKPLKPGRVVASRYNMVSSNQSFGTAIEAARKRSLPENEKEDCGKKARGSDGITEGGRTKKRWEIPPEIALYRRKGEEKEEEVEKEETTLLTTDLLPKIKTTRWVDESPRGSGPAKRVAELKGKKKSYFCPDNVDGDEEEEDGVAGSAVCEALNFAEQESDDNDEAEDET
ncbi:hypothetical protein QN277_002027 [Acacia crassicarpa]|uniref:Uncharacterized protein n=1 Tax=Acacia crassicarpa TaxID=499986 RepID=A0AAE1N9Y1_9FABA|nr:hypothetical protein QN277_002027 [Acacia crassicarpa]